MPSEFIVIVIELMFLGVNMFLALLRLSRAKNIFTPKNINSIVILKNSFWPTTKDTKQCIRPITKKKQFHVAGTRWRKTGIVFISLWKLMHESKCLMPKIFV